jgi:hypothetical protein
VSPRPDPAVDLVGALRWIMDKIEENERREDGRRVSARAAALALGFPAGYCHGKPWRVPRFGLEGTRHALSVWREWLSIPEAKRRSDWDAKPITERRKIRGVA